ncbi:hypothetical protein QE379_002999 [Sphingomonas sp. SORGH_AS 879]|nr:hypothetical protein [Sphingomonas sp. SORGH_AS_0879]
MSVARRRQMIERAHVGLSIAAQCRLVSISRSSFSYAPVPETAETLALMAAIDASFLDHPSYGSRQMARHLKHLGHAVWRRRVRRLMAKMGLAPIYQRPRTSDPHPEHRISPYLLRDLEITRSGHRWCADMTYLPMRRGFLYLVAVMALRQAQEGEPQATRLAVVEHDGRGILCRGVEESAGTLRQARNLQYGPGQPVHQHRLYRRVARGRGADQHGRARPLDGQCLYRTALAVAEVRMRLSERVRDRLRTADRAWPVDQLLQRAAASLPPRRPNAGRGMRTWRSPEWRRKPTGV